jgi:hypothetical protein
VRRSASSDLEGGVERQIHDLLLDARRAGMRYILA